MHTYLINISELTQQEGKEKEDGKPCVTSVTIILFQEIFRRKSHPPLNRSFCQRPENINLFDDHHKTHK